MFVSPETIQLVGELAAKMTGQIADVTELPRVLPQKRHFGEAV